MGFCFAVILFGYLCFAGKETLVKGICAYPCFMQNRSFQYINDRPEERVVFNGSIESEYNGDFLNAKLECIMRSGPFIMSRFKNSGNDTGGMYICAKYIMDENSGGTMTIYKTASVYLKDFPSICAVCNSKAFMEATPPLVLKDENLECNVVIAPNLGCNTPKTCSVTDSTTQSQCPCVDNPFESDSGFCCS